MRGIPRGLRARLRAVDHERRLVALTKQLDTLEDAVSIGRDELVTEMRAAHADGWTYYQIAQLTGFSQPTVKRWVVGDDKP